MALGSKNKKKKNPCIELWTTLVFTTQCYAWQWTPYYLYFLTLSPLMIWRWSAGLLYDRGLMEVTPGEVKCAPRTGAPAVTRRWICGPLPSWGIGNIKVDLCNISREILMAWCGNGSCLLSPLCPASQPATSPLRSRRLVLLAAPITLRGFGIAFLSNSENHSLRLDHRQLFRRVRACTAARF